MKTIQGDLIAMALAGDFDVIVHGCNCQCTMGAGIAKAIAKILPEALAADRATATGDPAKLGTFSEAVIRRGDIEFVVVNAYTQFQWRGDGRKADYDAIDAVFERIKQRFGGRRIGYPLIGAGLAGGDWEHIAGLIDERLAGEDHTLVRLPSA